MMTMIMLKMMSIMMIMMVIVMMMMKIKMAITQPIFKLGAPDFAW